MWDLFCKVACKVGCLSLSVVKCTLSGTYFDGCVEDGANARHLVQCLMRIPSRTRAKITVNVIVHDNVHTALQFMTPVDG